MLQPDMEQFFGRTEGEIERYHKWNAFYGLEYIAAIFLSTLKCEM
jgi:hypothetical protein